MNRVGDRLWVWGHLAGSQNEGWGLPRDSKNSPAEGADYLGVSNLLMVVTGGKPEPPFDDCAQEMRPLKRVVWSIIGDAGSTRNDTSPDLDAVIELSERFPNITGAIMDDFFHPPDETGSISRCTVEQLAEFRDRLHGAPRLLDLWAVLYTHDLGLPVKDYLDYCDVVTFWTWHARDLGLLEDSFARMEKVVPRRRKVLGCYMWDYGDHAEMPVELMKHQCGLGLKWLQQGRIEGMIFLASCICDLGLEAVEWTRKWIAEVGGQSV